METLLKKERLENCYAYDNTTYIITDNIDDPMKSLKKASIVLFEWLDYNYFRGGGLVLRKLNQSVVTDYFQQLELVNKRDSPNRLIIVKKSRTD